MNGRGPDNGRFAPWGLGSFLAPPDAETHLQRSRMTIDARKGETKGKKAGSQKPIGFSAGNKKPSSKK